MRTYIKNMTGIIRCSLVVLIFLCLNACGGKEEKKVEVLRPVKYKKVGIYSGEKIRTFSGIAKAAGEVVLSFRAGGIITEVKAKVGNRVKKGDLIARLDNVEARLALEKSATSVNSALSGMNTAKSELDRVKTLYEKNSASLKEYQAARNAYQNALAQYESAKRNQSIQATQTKYGFIYAPQSGVIAGVDGDVGESVQPGHQFATLNAGDGMQIEVGIPENLINKITTEMEVDLSFSSLDKKTFKGSVVEVAQITDKGAATYKVKIDVIAPVSTIRPGMAADVTFKFGKKQKEEKHKVVVPVKAVGEDGNGNFVFVVTSKDGKVGVVKKRKVVIGEISSDGFEIKTGLSQGELIATAGLQTLLDGQKVKLQ
ncbi:efflux RND transporter periplasmic adaptor subunit [uncultured Microscilla sp.]|uniref:efflux RND transporter periplasmic adaptor subunit n=1 Tax=uncultured Microscilla sp. TaxID=432653 RepID=UPI002616A506|nr:efflux RND transporter periplasmic adaptor subunit [uncultured Microscilla sp.]